jgi:hypothetical protein
MLTLHNPCHNHLLGALPEAELARISPSLELVEMPLGKVLHESGSRMQYAYFPISALVSMHGVMDNGAWAEIAGVGKEGMLGISLFIGSDAGVGMSFVRTAGYGYKMKSQKLAVEFERGGELRRLLLRYSHALITQTNQIADCIRLHSLEQQMCRWLLCAMDRLPLKDLILTQEVLASMLGALREDIEQVTVALQQYGIIRFRHGHLTILDREGLEDRACECYGVSKIEFDRLYGHGWRCDHTGGRIALLPVVDLQANAVLPA